MSVELRRKLDNMHFIILLDGQRAAVECGRILIDDGIHLILSYFVGTAIANVSSGKETEFFPEDTFCISNWAK